MKNLMKHTIVGSAVVMTRTFEFSCQGGGVQRCSSAKVGGWITP
jgi:hypothetical protein